MYILTLYGREKEGAYSVRNSNGEQIVYLFQEEDDAVRYAMLLEEDDYPEMHVIEIEDEIIIKACDIHDYQYTIITSEDIVIPPKMSSKFI